jgi:hypothetical protein
MKKELVIMLFLQRVSQSDDLITTLCMILSSSGLTYCVFSYVHTNISEENTASCLLYRLGGNNLKPSQTLTLLLAPLCALDLVLALPRASAIKLGPDPSILRLSYSPSAVNMQSGKSSL